MVVFGVLGAIVMALAANVLRRRQRCEPIERKVAKIRCGSPSSTVEDSDSWDLLVVVDNVPVSSMTRTRSGALWRAPPPFEVLRMAAWTS